MNFAPPEVLEVRVSIAAACGLPKRMQDQFEELEPVPARGMGVNPGSEKFQENLKELRRRNAIRPPRGQNLCDRFSHELDVFKAAGYSACAVYRTRELNQAVEFCQDLRLHTVSCKTNFM